MKQIGLNKTHLIATTIVVASGLIGATPFLLNHFIVENANTEFNSSVMILEASDNRSLGINADRNLDFGRLKTGSNATKFVNISIGKKSVLHLNTEGNISEILEHKDRMYVEVAQEIEIEAKGKQPGFYQGKINLEFHIPRNELGARWLDLKYKLYKLL